MDTPPCLKCCSTAYMKEEDAGLTYQSWRCTRCNVSRSKKNWFGKVLPFLATAIAFVMGIEAGGSDPADFGS